MNTITAVVHTKNSAKTLDLCLQSLAWCTETFVVDMQSTDETLTIAKKYKATTFTVKNEPAFVDPIRNEYLAKVKTDWTIIVDSDEEVSPDLAKKIQEVMMTSGVNGYAIPRLNIIFGKQIEHTGFWPDYIVRLFRTGKGTYPPRVHAQPMVDGKVVYLPAEKQAALIHHHYESIEQFVARMNTYTSAEVVKILEKEKTVQPLQALQAFFGQFFSRFFDQQGYKDGSYGFALSLLLGMYTGISYLKAWETQKSDQVISLGDVEDVVSDACSQTTYWVANESIKQTPNVITKSLLKIRRKLSS